MACVYVAGLWCFSSFGWLDGRHRRDYNANSTQAARGVWCSYRLYGGPSIYTHVDVNARRVHCHRTCSARTNARTHAHTPDSKFRDRETGDLHGGAVALTSKHEPRQGSRTLGVWRRVATNCMLRSRVCRSSAIVRVLFECVRARKMQHIAIAHACEHKLIELRTTDSGRRV